jgi:CubicO group peptidase (beta-lactamase class C family)/predicted esterase
VQPRDCGTRTLRFVLCCVFLAGCTAPAADAIFGRSGETQWIDLPGGRLKAEVYSTTAVSDRPTLVVALHGDIFDPTPSYQYAFAQALTQGFDAPAMPDHVRGRLGPHLPVNDVVAAGLLRPGYTDNAGDRSDGELGLARGDNYTAEVVDAVAHATRALAQRFMARRVILVGHSGGATIAAILLGRHPDVADAALLVACGCGETRSLQPLDVADGVRQDVIVRLLVGEDDDITPAAQSQRYAEVLRQRGVDAGATVLPGLGHNITFTQPVFAEAARLVSASQQAEAQTSRDEERDSFEPVTASAVDALVDPIVRQQLERRRIAGAVVTVVHDDAVVVSRGYGDADVEAGRRMTADTLVRIGSITKMFTAMAVMQLVESGRVDLDRDVRDYVDVEVGGSTGRSVTLRRLLSHQTGFEDRRGGIGTPSGARAPLGPFLASHLPPRLAQDDAALAYSNVNASLAAYVVERMSGMRFETYLADRVFGPLGMTSTTAEQPPADALRARVSPGYVTSDRKPTELSMSDAIIHEVGSTGIVSSANDMGRFLLTLVRTQPGVISRAALDSMMASQANVARGTIGLGFYSPVGVNGDPFVGHGGDTGSFHSVVALLPQQRFGVFVSYNSDGIPSAAAPQQELVDRLTERFFRHVPVPSRAVPAPGIDGTYAPARRVDSNVFSLRALVEQMAVRISPEALTLRPAFLPAGGLALREAAPGVYRGRGLEVSFDSAGGVPDHADRRTRASLRSRALVAERRHRRPAGGYRHAARVRSYGGLVDGEHPPES